MSNLKDTDFDDLFRRASDKYPLRTDSSNWDRMAAALEKDSSPDNLDDSDNTDKRRRRRFFWLFLLLPLAGVGYFTWRPSGHGATNSATTNTASTNTASTNVAGTLTTPTTAAPKNTTATNAASTPVATASTNKPATATATNKPGSNTLATNKPVPNTPTTTTDDNGGGKGGGNTNADANNNNAVRKNNAAAKLTTPATAGGQAGAGMPGQALRMANSNDPKGHRKGIRATGPDVPVRPTAENTIATKRANGTLNGSNGANNRFAADKTSIDKTSVANTADDNTPINPATNPVAASFTLRSANINEQRARIAGPYNLKVDVTAPAVQKDSTKQKAKPKKSSYLYAGILGAPDLSMVKFQSTKGVGSTLGILIGYAFNDRWSIETGAYVDRKRYYTDGEYFSTKKVRLPTNAQLLNVDGTCYMWEIPLNVRYNFNPVGKTRWFATAGLTTYLMNREKYTYAYKYSGPYVWNNSWDLKNPSQYPFSIIGLSAGFEQRLGKLGNLRVEPYVRLPLGGIGTGSLPIMSTGINIGITRRLW